MPEDDLSLKNLIRAVSDELLASRAERLAANLPPLFEVQELTIEVSFVVTESKGGGGGFDLKVIKADASVKYDRESVHKVTLTLKALESADLVVPDLPDTLPVRPRSRDEE
jgi:Trypsin-co-occurring domain 2